MVKCLHLEQSLHRVDSEQKVVFLKMNTSPLSKNESYEDFSINLTYGTIQM